MSRRLSNVPRNEMHNLNGDLLSCFRVHTQGTMSMSADQLIKFASECELLDDKKLTENEVGLMFSRVKLGKRTEIDFERFQECVRLMAVAKTIPYHQLVAECIRDRAVEHKAEAPVSVVGGGRPGTTAEYAKRLMTSIQVLELKDGLAPAAKVNIPELLALVKQVLEDSQQYLGRG